MADPVRFLRRAGLLALAAWLLVILPGCERTPRPNVLLVSIDSLRADRLGCYGYERPTSPTIDALAEAGATFEQAVGPSSWTLPTHVSMLTALPPEAHRVDVQSRRMSERILTLAEVMQTAGYATAAVVSGPFVGRPFGFAQGFESFDDSLAGQRGTGGVTSPQLVEKFSTWLDDWVAQGKSRPFLFFLHLWDVHYDYTPPEPYDRMFDPHYEGDITGRNFEKNRRLHVGMPGADLDHVKALYDGEIRWTDSQLAVAFERLATAGIADDTIVVVVADHGDEFFEHGFKGHSKQLYDESVRIPFVLRYPRKVRAGQRWPSVVRLMDVSPTILGLAGVPVPEGFGLRVDREGARAFDLSPWLMGRASAETFPEILAFAESKAWRPYSRSVRSGRYKLIRHVEGGVGPRFDTYDVRSDPAELEPLGEGPVQTELRRALSDWTAYWRRQDLGLSEPVKLGSSARERLRALGYVE